MKNPNGYGSITKMSGKRRNPWRVRITTGWDLDPDGLTSKQTRKTLGYYPTRAAAMEALVAYNKDPYDLSDQAMTFAEVYNAWRADEQNRLSKSSMQTFAACYNHSAPLHDRPFRELRVSHLETAIRQSGATVTMQSRILILYRHLYKYAMRHEIVAKDYAALCSVISEPETKIRRTPFSADEILQLWSRPDDMTAQMILVAIYSGWRPSELVDMTVESIDWQDRVMQGGVKTRAGKNRLVPIHRKIEAILRARCDAVGSGYIWRGATNYATYRDRFTRLVPQHYPHDTRHTFVTLAKEAGVDDAVLKRIVGHEAGDTTEDVYTHRSIEELHKEIDKIP